MKRDSKEYKLVTSMWILSCTDMPPQMTYKAIEQRCENGGANSAKSLVLKFPELFQRQIPEAQFNNWKKEMVEEKARPKWIVHSKNPKEIIDALKLNDVFRNRFRNSINADPTTTELLKWGLDYLNEHYSIKTESSERIWNRFATVILQTFALILAGVTVISSVCSNNNTIKLEHLAIQTDMLSSNCYTFLNSLNNSLYTGCVLKDKNKTLNDISNATSALYALSLILDIDDFKRIKNDIENYRTGILDKIGTDSISVHQMKEFEEEISSISIFLTDKLHNKFQFK